MYNPAISKTINCSPKNDKPDLGAILFLSKFFNSEPRPPPRSILLTIICLFGIPEAQVSSLRVKDGTIKTFSMKGTIYENTDTKISTYNHKNFTT